VEIADTARHYKYIDTPKTIGKKKTDTALCLDMVRSVSSLVIRKVERKTICLILRTVYTSPVQLIQISCTLNIMFEVKHVLTNAFIQ